MFWNYIKMTLRVLARNPLFSAINVGGLAIGLAAVITIFLFVRDEFSYDRFFANAESIYKIEMTVAFPGQPAKTVAMLQGIVPPTMAKDFPGEIVDFTRLESGQQSISVGDRKFRSEVASVDPGFLNIFNFSLIAGSLESALADPLSLVLTSSLATTLFGDAPALGQTVTLENGNDYHVTAIINDVPENSHFQFQALVSINEAALGAQMTNWGAIGSYGYLLLRPGVDVAALVADFPDMVNRNAPENMGRRMGLTAADLFRYSLINVRDIHLKGANEGAFKPGGDIQTLLTFSAIAGLILLIAGINFMNLSTARSLTRAREVAVRKSVGARRSQIIVQFLGEATVLAGLALGLAMVLVEIVIPAVNNMVSKTLSLDIAADPLLLAALLGLTIIVGIGAGLHPAFVMSSFRPADILKANQSAGGGGSTRLRTILVTAQFAISIGLITATSIVYLQTEHLKNMNPGFQKDSRMVLRGFSDPALRPRAGPMQLALEANPDIINTSMSMTTPGGGERQITVIDVPGVDTGDLLTMDVFPVDGNYFEVYGIKPVAGRLFDIEREADYMGRLNETEARTTASVVISLAALDTIDAPTAEDAIGRTFTMGTQSGQTEMTVIGVVPDLYFWSTRDEVSPGMFVMLEQQFMNMSIHFRTNDLAGLVAFVDETWASLVPEMPADHAFVDEIIARQYQDLERRTLLLAIFAGLAALVSSLGMFALASLSARQRTKEIGIRKVMGAEVPDIVRLMVWQLSKPALLANIIAVPAAWYLTQDWLAGFAYRMELTPMPFVIAGAGGLLIAWLTIAGHAWRVARSNPIIALRYE